jgi:hypothetical protein
MKRIVSASAVPVFGRRLVVGEFEHHVPEWDGPLMVVMEYEDGHVNETIMSPKQYEILVGHIKRNIGGNINENIDGIDGPDS